MCSLECGLYSIHSFLIHPVVSHCHRCCSRYGPERCIPLPDIAALMCPGDRHTRFILASDGVWDVMDEKDIMAICAVREKASTAAQQIARRAFDIRVSHGHRLDDISVIVVDIHPELFMGRHGTTSATCTIC